MRVMTLGLLAVVTLAATGCAKKEADASASATTAQPSAIDAQAGNAANASGMNAAPGAVADSAAVKDTADEAAKH